MNIQSGITKSDKGHVVNAELEVKNVSGSSFIYHQLLPHPFHITVPFNINGDPEDLISLYLQSSSGGLYDRDFHKFNLKLHQNSKLHLTSQASTIVHRAKENIGAVLETNLTLLENSYLEFMPDPIILMADSKFFSTTAVELKSSSQAMVAESFLVHDPDGNGTMFQECFSETSIIIDDKLVANEKVHLLGEDYFARIKGYNCIGSIYIYNFGTGLANKLKQHVDSIAGVLIGCSVLDKLNLIIIKIIADEATTLSCGMESAWEIAREDLTGDVPKKRRK